MSKERLRGIENRFRMTLKIFDLIDDDDLLTKDVLWLIEQNKRYREAIENVLEIENYGVAADYIKTVTNILLEALEGEE